MLELENLLKIARKISSGRPSTRERKGAKICNLLLRRITENEECRDQPVLHFCAI